MRLFHFSEEPEISVFVPRPVKTPVNRPLGQEWLNGPLVWAIDEQHAFLYLFPRECPRILVWATAATSTRDRIKWLGDSNAKAVAFIEEPWEDRLRNASIVRYEFSSNTFKAIGDVGMFVSEHREEPIASQRLFDLPGSLRKANVEMRVVEQLNSIRDVWDSSVHASGIRLRNAKGWAAPGGTHSRPQ